MNRRSFCATALLPLTLSLKSLHGWSFLRWHESSWEKLPNQAVVRKIIWAIFSRGSEIRYICCPVTLTKRELITGPGPIVRPAIESARSQIKELALSSLGVHING